MRRVASLIILYFIFFTAFVVPQVQADVPLNNLEGVGGIAFNPVAYLAGTEPESEEGSESTFLGDIGIGKPRSGSWYAVLPEADVNWLTFGISDTLFHRLEISYGYEFVDLKDGVKRHKNNLGAKLLLVPENWRDASYIPAVSAGVLWKNTTDVGAGARPNGVDGYLVATKLVTQLPLKVLLSGGGLLTQGRTTGVLGYDHRSDITLFGNIDLLVTDYLAVGYEIKEGAKFSSFKNADYWDFHIAWMPNPHVTVVAAYIYTGDEKEATVGLGNGLAISLQYAF